MAFETGNASLALLPVYLRVLYIVYKTQNTRQGPKNRVGYKTIKNK